MQSRRATYFLADMIATRQLPPAYLPEYTENKIRSKLKASPAMKDTCGQWLHLKYETRFSWKGVGTSWIDAGIFVRGKNFWRITFNYSISIAQTCWQAQSASAHALVCDWRPQRHGCTLCLEHGRHSPVHSRENRNCVSLCTKRWVRKEKNTNKGILGI